MSNSGAIKERIAELRRQRASAIGKIERAQAAILNLRYKISGENSRYHEAGRQIEELGGKIRR